MPVHVGSGVVPFFEREGDVHFVLGIERHVQGWAGSRKWSSFAGGKKNAETAVETAVREFGEETLLAMPFTSRLLLSKLAASEYALRVVVANRARRQHVTYFTPLHAQDERCVRAFQTTRRHVRLASVAQTKMRRLARVVTRFNASSSVGGEAPLLPFFPPRPAPSPSSFPSADLSPPAHCLPPSPFVADPWVERVALCGDRLVVSLSSSSERAVDVRLVPADVLAAYVDWFRYRNALSASTRIVLARCPSAVLCHTSRGVATPPLGCGVVESVVFDDSFLEKDMLLFWSLAELRKVVSDGETRPFKASFHPVMQAIVREFGGGAARGEEGRRPGSEQSLQ